MADLLDSIRAQIDARLDELRPLVDEAASLEAALAALEDAAPRAARRRGPRRPVGRSSGRPRRGEMRARVIEHVRANPGSTAGDVAEALGLNRDSVATRLAVLAKSGELAKATRGYSAP
jgi:hypothetical protein